jgi:SAM-dependent methyltransferase
MIVSHPDQMWFFDATFKHFPDLFSGKVLDIGSMDLNGGPHLLLNPQSYTGVDVAQGPNVNLVKSGHLVDFNNEHFDASISSECFEHNIYWAETFRNMVRMTKNCGIVAISAAGIGRQEHGTNRTDGRFASQSNTQDYYKNSSKRDLHNVSMESDLASFFIIKNWYSKDVYFVAIKNCSDSNTLINFTKLQKEIRSFAIKKNLFFIVSIIKSPIRNLISLTNTTILNKLVFIKHSLQQLNRDQNHISKCFPCRIEFLK